MDFLLQIQISIYVRDTDFFVYVEGRNGGGEVGDTACGSSIKDTDSCVYVCPEFLAHPWPFTFWGRGHFLFECSESLCCKLVPLHL